MDLQNKQKTDTSALEARNGKDIQGIPWERLTFTRDKCRETRLQHYKNYENLSRSHEEIEKVGFFIQLICNFDIILFVSESMDCFHLDKCDV